MRRARESADENEDRREREQRSSITAAVLMSVRDGGQTRDRDADRETRIDASMSAREPVDHDSGSVMM